MPIHSRARTGALLALALAIASPAAAQSSETCMIGAAPPAFVAGEQGDRLHALPHPSAAAHTALHGQGLFGLDTLYLSHLAVFMGLPEAHPHNFQVILEVAFEDEAAAARYRADRAQHPDLIYTAVPPVFDQTALVTRHLGREPLRRLPGTAVVRGHFEQGGVAILQGEALEIRRVVHFREFLGGGARLETQHYFLFGRGDDIFLTHLLSAPPDFNQVLAVALEAPEVLPERMADLVEGPLAQGLYLALPERENTVARRLRAGEELSCSLAADAAAAPLTLLLRVAAEAYCEEGEFDRLVTTRFNDPRPC